MCKGPKLWGILGTMREKKKRRELCGSVCGGSAERIKTIIELEKISQKLMVKGFIC